MSSFDTNPFADPVDVNPFQDPSVTQLTNAPQSGLAEFNPFSETNAATTVPVTQLPGPSQPAVLQPSVEPTQPTPQLLRRQASRFLPTRFLAVSELSERQMLLGGDSILRDSYMQKLPKAVASAAQASLLRQQEELDRKAAELERKERELQNTVANLHVRENNWPPLPFWCPVKPCFYQDFSVEIPADYQRICKMLYYLWMLHSVTLFLNLLACLAWFLVDSTNGVNFGLSILWFIIFTPCAFLCWYRPIYKAFRSDNSFSFFVFFFVFFCQIGIYIIQLVGIPGLGDSGWIAALSTLKKDHLAVSIIMMVVAGFFTLCAVLSLFLLKRVHSLYRRTGASFQQAQEEFSQGIFSNRTFRSAASNAARGAFQGN
ncbi:secretory carrier-associated membrane protein 2 isoform X2 [Prionailurus viverrinus]|uniref:Secretory carrier-associated membrane protein n=1 Tax=Puma concolor TaxID=9696 RepID=A0A6P6HET7_PUMCO|nr:secretory carrier-associated membrane protein 2 isoform X1 [Puma concolor]XP_043410934.1 secretory carrier-associated membrane protein 2 isoform X2 [Prionailurus bengalensis]XP_046930748.1 secretory carrier-associated membrane protein 2 isoform X2 [Lynx rufus]XP_047720178.1 secretory carrier-associated membrane protein 2 isoform X2 [Prionailurus viverrinus]